MIFALTEIATTDERHLRGRRVHLSDAVLQFLECYSLQHGRQWALVLHRSGKNGLYYEYGNTAELESVCSAGSTPYAWMLNKMRDRQTQADNLIVTYSTTSGAVQPASIQYTQTPSHKRHHLPLYRKFHLSGARDKPE